MHYIVESIEEGVAMLESGDEYMELPASCLPEAVQEGDLLRLDVTRDAAVAVITFTLADEAVAEPEPALVQLRRDARRRADPDLA